MDKFIPISKQTKKQQKEYYSKQRSTWNGLNPATRTVPNGKGYDRNKQKQQDRRSGRASYYKDDICRFCCCLIFFFFIYIQFSFLFRKVGNAYI